MKTDISGFITKGIVYLICGILIGFLPGVVNWIFYILGGIIIISSIFMLLGGMSSGADGSLVGGSLAGVIIGAIIMLVPKILHIGIPIAAGIFFFINGITRIVKAFKEESSGIKKTSLIFGIFVLLFGCFLLAFPYRASTIARIIIGIVLIILGVFNFYVASVAKKRNADVISTNDIIDI